MTGSINEINNVLVVGFHVVFSDGQQTLIEVK